MLAITTDIATTSRGRFTLTELDQEALFRPLTKWNRVIDSAAAIPSTLRMAFTQMTTGRPGAVHIGLPYDVQKAPVDEADVWADPQEGSPPRISGQRACAGKSRNWAARRAPASCSPRSQKGGPSGQRDRAD